MKKGFLNLAIVVMSVGIISFNNVTTNKKIEQSESIVYVSQDNIQEGTELKKDMFLGVKVNKDNISKDYITNLNDVDGKIIKKPISKHQLILKSNLSTDKTSINNELVSIPLNQKISYINKSDSVNIYATYQIDKENKAKIEIAKNKIVKDINEKSIVISLSKEELLKYMDNLNSNILVTKIN